METVRLWDLGDGQLFLINQMTSSTDFISLVCGSFSILSSCLSAHLNALGITVTGHTAYGYSMSLMPVPLVSVVVFF